MRAVEPSPRELSPSRVSLSPHSMLPSLSIPEELGHVEESYAGSSDKTVIFIQDAHDSLEAQENIAKLIQYFVQKYGVQTVFEEGYEGRVPTDEYFNQIADGRWEIRKTCYLKIICHPCLASRRIASPISHL